ncbi:hypothetical protein N1851_006051 [Merluccius polli]|uniref:Uncharacterized protein n=1 Tax=Merluccius polli TaxID=89951 RepID=A0AA47N6E2_MERPO|nr:hypothetical protein N1851_006051 [Merluccius polli]
MGARESRPRLSQVAPVHSQDGEPEAQEPSKPQWTLPALALPAEQRTSLPPLRRTEATLSTLSGNLPCVQSNDPSIIRSYPPKRLQRLQPLAFPIGHTNTVTTNAMVRDHSGGVTQRYSTPRGEEPHGGISQTQEGFLAAQGALHQQTYRHRRAHHRQARGHRRTLKTVYTPNVGDPGREGGRLVRRPTERDIFGGECRGGECVDVSLHLLLQPSPLPPLGYRDATPPPGITWSRRDTEKKTDEQHDKHN